MKTELLSTLTLRKHPHYIRGQVNKAYVSELAQVLKDGKGEWPFPNDRDPITVIAIPPDHDDRKDGGAYWILDGTNRTLAALEVQRPSVPCQVLSGLSEGEQIAYQVKTNNAHGLRLTVTAQTNAIKTMKNVYKMTQIDIGKKTGLTQASVSRILSGKQRTGSEGKEGEGKEGEGKEGKKPTPVFDAEKWMKRLAGVLKGWKSHGSKIRRKGFPETCNKAMDTLVSKLLENETEE